MGIYPAKNLESFPPALREKYFEPSGTQFAFRPDLRRRVIFGRHDITRDAPISRLDLLVCRNTLMYFNVEAQSQSSTASTSPLREGGYLFLGKAEMLLSDGNRFEVASMRQRIFRRRPGDGRARYQRCRRSSTPPAALRSAKSAGTPASGPDPGDGSVRGRLHRRRRASSSCSTTRRGPCSG